MSIELTEAVLLVLLGGLFGYSLGKLGERVVWGTVAVCIILIVVVLSR